MFKLTMINRVNLARIKFNSRNSFCVNRHVLTKYFVYHLVAYTLAVLVACI